MDDHELVSCASDSLTFARLGHAPPFVAVTRRASPPRAGTSRSTHPNHANNANSLWRRTPGGRAAIAQPDAAARTAARERQDRLTKPTGALGRLEELSVWLSGVSGTCPPPPISRPALAIFAGDHGIARTARTSAYPPEVTAQMVASFLAGGAGATVLARSRGVRVRVVDVSVDADWAAMGLAVPDDVTRHRIRRGAGSIDREDAMTREQALAALDLGARIADELVDDGADLLIGGDMGIGNTTPAAVLVGLLTDSGPADVVGRGTGIDDVTWMRKSAAVRDAMRRGRPLADDPVGLLAAVTGPDLAAMTGFLLQAAVRGVPVLLDGIVSSACALLAVRIAPDAAAWWQAAHRSTEPAAGRALDALGLEPILDLGLRLGEGSGALVALPVLTAAGDLLREMATFESAGVSDRSAPAGAPMASDHPVSGDSGGAGGGEPSRHRSTPTTCDMDVHDSAGHSTPRDTAAPDAGTVA